MKTTYIKALTSAVFFSACIIFSLAQTTDNNIIVGDASMSPAKNIAENIVQSNKHTTLVSAVKAAGLTETLQSKGPFTVFAPVNDAFENLPAGMIETLVMPENKVLLTTILSGHVITGKYDYITLEKMIVAGKGIATLKTINGGTLTCMKNGPHNIIIKDETGAIATICTYDVIQSNGIIHVVDSVLIPK